MVHAVGVAEGVVALQLLVAPRVMQERRRLARARRLGVKTLACGDELRVVHHMRRVHALELHHRRQRTRWRSTIRIHIRIVLRPQFREKSCVHRLFLAAELITVEIEEYEHREESRLVHADKADLEGRGLRAVEERRLHAVA